MKIANRIVITFAGLLLIVASLMKVHQMLTEPIVSKGLWESWIFFLVTVPLELSLGIWLVSGLFRKAAWLMGTLSFGFFIGVTTYKAVTGELSCGCFGTVHVNPWITLFSMDIPLFILLLIFFPRREKLLPPPWPHPFHCLFVAIPASFFVGALVPTLYFNKVPDVVVDETGKETIRVVRPENWTVKPDPAKTTQASTVEPNIPVIAPEPNQTELAVEVNIPAVIVETTIPAEANDINVIEQVSSPQPDANDIPEWKLMLNHVDIADQLLTDVRIVLFYHYDCPDCVVAIPLYSQYSRDIAADEHIQFAFVKGPPYGPEDEDPVPDDTTALIGKLDQSRDWIFESPLIFLLNDGELIKWWLVEYPDFEQIIQTMITAQ